MSETTTEVKQIKIRSTFGEVLGSIEPEMVRGMIVDKLDTALNLTRTYNKGVGQIQESSKNNPEDPEFQDMTWERVVKEMEDGEREADPELLKIEKRFQQLTKQREEMLSKLREASKSHMEDALSEEEIAAKKKELNESKPAIIEAQNSAKALAEMADGLMGANAIEGGVMSLMPTMNSMLNVGRRKTSGGKSVGGGSHVSRIGATTIDGVDAGINGKYSLAFVAKKLSDEFNAKTHPENAVTNIELEEAMYKAAGVTYRERDSLPEVVEFDFTKDIAIQNPNDDSVTMVPQVKKISIQKYYRPS